MKVTRGFVKFYLVLFILVILGNLTALTLGKYQSWMGDTFLGFFIFFWILFLRKKLNKKLDSIKEKKFKQVKPVKANYEARKPAKFHKLLVFIMILLVLGIAYLLLVTPTFIGKFPLVISVTILLFVLLFIAFFTHRVYEKSVHHISPSFALAISYSGIIAVMFSSPRYFSLEWAFLGFLILAVVFYDFKIDSRFLILPALLLLGWIPFLLTAFQKELAEIIAVFVYYFLVVGVILQIIEYYKKSEIYLDFTKFMRSFMDKEKILNTSTILGIITVGIIIWNRFTSRELMKWTSVYIFVVIMVFYGIAHLQEDKSLEQKK